ENLYLANGFQDVKVDAQIMDNYQSKEGDLFVKFVIQEGEQTRVASLNLVGNTTFSNDDILGVVASSPGQPYSDFNVGTDRANILALYYNEGFPEADIQTTCAYVGEAATATTAPDAAPNVPLGASTVCDPASATADHKVALVYRIAEGPQTRV